MPEEHDLPGVDINILMLHCPPIRLYRPVDCPDPLPALFPAQQVRFLDRLLDENIEGCSSGIVVGEASDSGRVIPLIEEEAASADHAVVDDRVAEALSLRRQSGYPVALSPSSAHFEEPWLLRERSLEYLPFSILAAIPCDT